MEEIRRCLYELGLLRSCINSAPPPSLEILLLTNRTELGAKPLKGYVRCIAHVVNNRSKAPKLIMKALLFSSL
jgi:hypothetical protein